MTSLCESSHTCVSLSCCVKVSEPGTFNILGLSLFSFYDPNTVIVVIVFCLIIQYEVILHLG